MSSGRSRRGVDSSTSRRQMRQSDDVHKLGDAHEPAEAHQRRAQRKPSGAKGSTSVTPTWVPKTALLMALSAVTIALPVLQAVSLPGTAGSAAALAAGYPTSFQVLSAAGADGTSTSLLASGGEVLRVSDMVSRSHERTPLPECSGSSEVGGSNGLLDESELCTLWDGRNALRGDAAVTLAELNRNFHVVFGRDLCMTDSYRTLAEQQVVARTKGYLAATPGTSNHGEGLAVDLCTSETTASGVLAWLNDNGPTYGWTNPPWARRGGAGAYEPWHWEYLPGTRSLGTDYSD